jgi:hypothetical protein
VPPQARADQNGTAQEGKEKSYRRDDKSKVGAPNRIVEITASKDQREHQESATEAKPYDTQYPAARGAREVPPVGPVALPRGGQQIGQVDGHRQNQGRKQHNSRDSRENPCLEGLAQILPAGREGGGIFRRGSAPIKVVGIGIGEKQAQANGQVAQEADESEEKPGVPSGGMGWFGFRGGRDPFCALVLASFQMNRSAYGNTSLLMSAHERQTQSQDKTGKEGKSEARRREPDRRACSLVYSKRRE